MRSFYEILGVSRKCSQEEIISAYRKKVIETHPDKGGDSITFQNVRKAYEILSNPEIRENYDLWLNKKESEEYIKSIRTNISDIKNDFSKRGNTVTQNKKKKISYIYIFTFCIGMFAIHYLLKIGFKDNEHNTLNNTTKNEIQKDYTKIDSIAAVLEEEKNTYSNYKINESEEERLKSIEEKYTENSANKHKKKNNQYDNRKWLYEALVKKGYNPGNYDSYNSSLEYEVERRYLYEVAREKGLDTGTFEEFNKALGFTDSPHKTNKSNNSSNYTRHEIKESYKEVKFSTGDRPYVSYYGKGKYDTSSLSKITFINYSQTDAVVLLVEDGCVIRNNFISRGDSFTMNFIPKGEYTIRVMFGNSWNPNKDNGSGYPKGGFMKNISFMKSKDYDTFDCWPEETYGGINYPTYSVTLHKVSNGNMNTENINKSEFFN